MSTQGPKKGTYKLGYVAPKVGRKVGPNSEFTLVFKVKPGHAEELNKELQKFGEAVNLEVALFAGLHDSRLCLFDNGTRMLFCTTFDGDLDRYVDDAITGLLNLIHPWARYLEGYPGTIDSPPSDLNEAKEWTVSHCHTSGQYFRAFPRTVPESLKAFKVYDAFQKVLDNPAAAKALQDPALQPLLELASE